MFDDSVRTPRVSIPSPKVMHWITELILWLFNNDDDQNPKLTDAAVSIAAQATTRELPEWRQL